MSYREAIIAFHLLIGTGMFNSIAMATQPGHPVLLTTKTTIDTCPDSEVNCSWTHLLTDDKFGTLPTIRGMAVDPLGNTYLAGETYPSNYANNTSKILITKHNMQGELIWIRRISASGLGQNIAYSIDVNTGGSLCFAGTTDGTFDSTAPKRSRGFIALYDTDGNKIWTRHTPQRTISVSIDNTDNCYARSARALTKYDAKGKLVWNNHSKTNAITVSQDSQLYSVAQTTNSLEPVLSIFNHLGKSLSKTELKLGKTLNWSKIDLRNISLETDSHGNGYLQGTVSGIDHSGISRIESYASKFTPDGTILWENHQGSDGYRIDTFNITVDKKGNSYLVGTTMTIPTASPRDVIVIMYATDGSLQWLKKFGTPKFDAASSIGVDLSGNYYIAGATKGNLGGQNNTEHKNAVPFIARNHP